MAELEKLPAPDAKNKREDVEVNIGGLKKEKARRYKMGLIPIVLIVCILSSGFTTWLLLAFDVVSPDLVQTITENREKLVLQEGEIVSDVFDRVSPSVVSITTTATTASSFFEASVQEGAGSGIIISSDGYIITNKHVVPEGIASITVVLADGKEYTDISVIGRDPSNDIAFLKINNVKDLPSAVIGDSDSVGPGQKVVAIGNALGEFRNSVTTGIISGIGRPIEASDGAGSSEVLQNLFQTDAAINPGNSGGPLVNLRGEVIGINTAIAESAEGIGFSIPINDAKGTIKTVLEQGKLIKPYLGVRYLSIDSEVAEELNLSVTSGAYIKGDSRSSAIVPNSPAEKAGLREGDIITEVDGRPITETSYLASLLGAYAPGDKVTLTYIRDGETKTAEVKLEVYPGIN